MTFQVALVGVDGLVIASDRKVVTLSQVPLSTPVMQQGEQDKFIAGEDGSIVCFYAGGPSSHSLASMVALNCGQLETSELRWETAVCTRVDEAHRVSSQFPDQVLISRRDNAKAVWLVLKHAQLPASINKVTDHIFTGHNADARFLISRLWRKEAPIAELRRLALLVLAYATAENPTSIGPPYDIMTLNGHQLFVWSRYDPLENLPGEFDLELRAAFDRTVPIRMSS